MKKKKEFSMLIGNKKIIHCWIMVVIKIGDNTNNKVVDVVTLTDDLFINEM